MGELAFVGLGLNKETDISLKGMDKAKNANVVFAEFYTSLMPGLDLKSLEDLIGKKVRLVSRRDLEEEAGRIILDEAQHRKIVLLVPGDPMIATTHIDLRIRAHKKGIKTLIVHNASIMSALAGLSGLQNYKFGRSVTIPFGDGQTFYETPYNVIAENKKRGLHTMCFLDIRSEERKYMTINDGLQVLFALEKRIRQNVITPSALAVGIGRAGSEDPTVKAGFTQDLLNYEFGKPPHSLAFPGRLHFIEAEALVTLAGAPTNIREMVE